jgi:hypothetical protein
MSAHLHTTQAWAHDITISLAITELLNAVSLNAKLAQFLYRSLNVWDFDLS